VSLSPGVRLGPYEVTALIGEGGMGKVWRAHHMALKRDDALKVLPDAFATDPDRLARFQREAQVLASLNHPNIAHVYGLEQANGVQALVMELVEGPTLADRIAQGRIAIDEALHIAKQIAEALEAAHEQNIIHRDLKPANIKLRPDGTVKVLDFGLAKLTEPTGSAAAAGATLSPTVTSPAMMTGVGVLLGTAAYMSPEQAKGKPADKRSDIWAFGCVLYEMLTGTRAFGGNDVTDTLAFIITKEPDWRTLPASTPAQIRRLRHRGLEKDRKRRLADAADARLEIDDALTAPSHDASAVTGAGVAIQRVGWRHLLPWGVAGITTLTLAVVLVRWAPWRTAILPVPVRLEAALGADASLDTLSASLAVSSDGSLLAFTGRTSQGTQQLYVRRLGELRAVPLTGTTNAQNPFFSPDAQWIGFFAEGSLKKIAVTGGAAVTVCAAVDDRGGTWGEDGSIIFQAAGSGAGLSRVSSSGGTPVPLTKLGAGEITHRWPQVLPGGKAVLYTAHSSVADFDDATIVVQPLPDGAPKIVQRGGYYGRYLPSGHLVYINQGTVFAEAFDLGRLEPTGQPAPVIEGISTYTGQAGLGGRAGSAELAWTESGTVVYLPGQNAGDEAPIELMDRTGKVTALRATRAIWRNSQFSPDGRQLAVDIVTGQATDVFTYDWERDTLTRATFGTSLNLKPVWTPDGRRLVFRSTRNSGVFNLYWQRADGSGEIQQLAKSQNPQSTGSWHPSGKLLAFWESRPQTGNDLMILPLEGDETSGWKPGKPTVFLSTPFNEQEPMFSPDGRWIAYQSSESGRAEVYVRPFPGPGGKWQISTDGGTYPTWSRTRQELFYGGSDNHLMVTSYATDGNSFKADKPRVWSQRRFMTRPGRSFDLHPDGERFALAAAPENQAAVRQDKLVFIFNFFDELRRIAPAPSR
jgi:Tol biopolymer transport system component